MKKEEIYPYFKLLVVILLVICLGMFAVNQTLTFVYKSQFLQTPCELCYKLNPNQSNCISGCFEIKKEIFYDGIGNWKDASGNCYDAIGNKIECKEIKINETNLN